MHFPICIMIRPFFDHSTSYIDSEFHGAEVMTDRFYESNGHFEKDIQSTSRPVDLFFDSGREMKGNRMQNIKFRIRKENYEI